MELDSSNEKALYRRGEARLSRNEFSLALEDFHLVLQVNPSNRAARCQIGICQRKIREHHERDKKIYANMFQKFAEHDAKVNNKQIISAKPKEFEITLKILKEPVKKYLATVCSL